MLRLDIVRVSCAATPKSASFTPPLSVRRILLHLMSRWILKIEWRYTRPFNDSPHRYAICASFRGRPEVVRTSRTLPPPQCSITIQRYSSPMNEPKYRTTLGCTHSWSTAISRRMSSRPSSSSPARAITFTATIVPLGRWRALYTAP